MVCLCIYSYSLPKLGPQEPVAFFNVGLCCFSLLLLCVNINDCSRLSVTHFHPTEPHIIYFRMTLVSNASAL